MKTKQAILFAPALILSVLLLSSGCQNLSGSSYSSSAARQQMSVVYGTITHMEAASVEGSSGVVGGVAGGVLGGVVGSAIGGGSGNRIATAAGALSGAALGAVAERGMTKQNAVMFEVQLDNGNIMSIVQAMGNDSFQVGQRVRVLTQQDGTTHIRPF